MKPLDRRLTMLGMVALLAPVSASAADLHVMISAGFYEVYAEVGPAFERTTGHRLITTRGPSMGDSPEAIPTRLARGEAADVVILDGGSADELTRQGVVRAGSKVDLARSQIGMVVRAGAAKPDIGTVDAFRRMLLDAASIGYSDSGSGIYLSTNLFATLGVADQVARKSRKVRGPPSGEPVAAVVARGEVEIGFQQVSELLHVPGVTFVGAIPGELQPGFSFAGAITVAARQPDAALALLRFLASPAVASTLVKAGLQPSQRTIVAPTGTLRASFISTNPVHGRVDPQTGATAGPAPDLVRELARRLGVQAEIIPLPDAAAVLESVKSGRVDLAFLALDAERALQVDFSDPYLSSAAAYAVRANSTFQKSDDMDRAGVTIGTFVGQAPGVYLREHVKSARVEFLPTVPANAVLGAMLLDGKVDAFGANRTRMEELVRDVPGLRVLPDDYMVTGQAIVVPKGNAARLAEINRFLADARTSGFVKVSLDRANIAGVTVAPEPKR